MSAFYIAVGICILVAFLCVVFPWLRRQDTDLQETLSNKSVIKQRLDELLTEQEHGLLSDTDRVQSENELKLTLLDEVDVKQSSFSSVKIAFVIGALLSVFTGATVYWYANQLKPIEHWLHVKSQTSELGQRMVRADETLNLEDMQNFALGLRTKLIETPEDAVGWMLLGRVSGAINRLDSAIQAFEKSLQYDPNNVGTLSSYAQALLMTGQEQKVLQAKRILLHILNLEPDNTNAMGVLAIVASELGDKPLALQNWQSLLSFIPDTDPNYFAVNQRIEQLQSELSQTESSTPKIENSQVSSDEVNARVSITVNVNKNLVNKLPKEGFLFVFAQESSGQVRMPAAVVKMPLRDFPVVVELSNANAMMPNYKLSQLKQAKLVARISLDENVAQAPGELQGEWLATLSTEKLTQETITIDRVL